MGIPFDILDWPETAEIEASGDMRGNHQDARIVLFLRLIAMSLHGERFGNAAQFERAVRKTKRKVTQAQTVWDTCIRLGILTDEGGGFSLAKWLKSKTCENLRSEAPASVETCVYMPRPKNSQQRANLVAKNGIDARCGLREIPNDMPVGKIPVRENVMLTPAENAGLRARFGADYDAMLDRLSIYKRQSGKEYASDAAAIEGWVADAFAERRRKHAALDPLAGADLTLLGIGVEK